MTVYTWTSRDCTCTLDDVTGVFTVTGTGAMANYTAADETDPDYDPNAQAPWSSRRTSILTIVIDDGVTRIGNYAFYRCTNLASLNLGSVTDTGGAAFTGCTALQSVTIPDSVTTLGPSTFQSCGNLTTVIIPDSVTYIRESTFNGCTALQSVTIPDTVTRIGQSAFRNCLSLTSITIPASVTTFGNNVFNGCTALTSITFEAASWDITIGTTAFSLGTSEAPVTCDVYSPNNIADTRLDPYKGDYTTFTYLSPPAASVQPGDWNDPATWGGLVPGADTDAIVRHPLTIGASAEVGGVTFDGGGLTIDGDLPDEGIGLTASSVSYVPSIDDSTRIRMDGGRIITSPRIVGQYEIVEDEGRNVIIDDGGPIGISSTMADMKPEGYAPAYARRVSCNVRYQTITIHIRADRLGIVGKLMRMADGPYQVLAVTNSAVIKGYIEQMAPVFDAGKEYITYRLTIAEGLR